MVGVEAGEGRGRGVEIPHIDHQVLDLDWTARGDRHRVQINGIGRQMKIVGRGKDWIR